MKSVLYIGIGVLLGLAAVIIGWQLFGGRYSYQGSLIDPPVKAADFELLDQEGNPFRLSDQRGNVSLIFFGYTNCPDVCPVTLSEFRRVKEQLGTKANFVRFIYITVDPERDTRDRMKQFLANFDPQFIGLSGDLQDLQAVWKHFGVYAEKREVGSSAGYLVDHTAIVYAIDKAGNWRLTYPFGMEPEKMAADVLHLVDEE